MAVIPATQLRTGMLITYNNELHRVTSVVHVTPGNWRGMVQTKLRNLRTGTQTENRFRSEDKVDRVTLEQHEMEFLYQSDDQYYFMNTETFEQVHLGTDVLGDSALYLLPDSVINVEFFEGEPVGIHLPATVDLKVSDTVPGIKGATASAQVKPATLETGLVVNVPAFIETGDTIRVNTETGEYLGRV